MNNVLYFLRLTGVTPGSAYFFLFSLILYIAVKTRQQQEAAREEHMKKEVESWKLQKEYERMRAEQKEW